MSITVIPTQANRIRAAAAAAPKLTTRQLALMLGTHRHLVELALRKSDNRRIRSVAPTGSR